MSVINRLSRTVTATIANAATTSDAIDLTEMAFGSFAMPAAFTGATVSFTGCATSGGTFVAINDSSNAAVSRTVTVSKAYALPAECFAFNFIKIVSASSEGGARSIVVTAKS